MNVQQIIPQGQKPSSRRFPWLFWVAFGAILTFTLVLIDVTIWLVRTLGADRWYTRLRIIASIIAILSNLLILLFTITKWPERKEGHPSSQLQSHPQPIMVQLIAPPASSSLPLSEERMSLYDLIQSYIRSHAPKRTPRMKGAFLLLTCSRLGRDFQKNLSNDEV